VGGIGRHVGFKNKREYFTMPRYISGFTTLEKEVEMDNVPVSGELPPWLSGTLVRNGPAKFEIGKRTFNHWFDGLSMLHRFMFRDGTVSYANKFLKSRDYRESRRQGKITLGAFATDPCSSIFRRVFSLFAPQITENANVNVAKIADRYIAMTETPLPIEFDPRTLETLGVLNYDEDETDGSITTAHPHFDFERSLTISYNIKFSRNSKYIVYRMPEGSLRREPIVEIPVQKPAYIHSFGMSENYIILVEFPLIVNPLRLLLSGKPFIENYAWEPERNTRFHLIGKEDGSIRSYCSEPFFAFHHINAFEKNGDVLVDIAAYPDPQIIDAFYLKRLRAGERIPLCELRRYRLPAGSETAKYERITGESIELPRLNYKRNGGKDYSYVYGVSNCLDHPVDFFDQLVKVDVKKQTARVWREEGCYVGEPVFVAAPDAAGEDEGVVLSVVLDADKSSSFLLVLDAESFAEIARAAVPHSIPFGFHGQFFKQ
jgi:beta,beta-carotene 9',10'-dioxygenase